MKMHIKDVALTKIMCVIYISQNVR